MRWNMEGRGEGGMGDGGEGERGMGNRRGAGGKEWGGEGGKEGGEREEALYFLPLMMIHSLLPYFNPRFFPSI